MEEDEFLKTFLASVPLQFQKTVQPLNLFGGGPSDRYFFGTTKADYVAYLDYISFVDPGSAPLPGEPIDVSVQLNTVTTVGNRPFTEDDADAIAASLSANDPFGVEPGGSLDVAYFDELDQLLISLETEFPAVEDLSDASVTEVFSLYLPPDLVVPFDSAEMTLTDQGGGSIIIPFPSTEQFGPDGTERVFGSTLGTAGPDRIEGTQLLETYETIGAGAFYEAVIQPDGTLLLKDQFDSSVDQIVLVDRISFADGFGGDTQGYFNVRDAALPVDALSGNAMAPYVKMFNFYNAPPYQLSPPLLATGTDAGEQALARHLYDSQIGEIIDALSVPDLVDMGYREKLRRDPDDAGRNYWVNELETGSIPRDLFFLAFWNGALDNPDPLALRDLQTIDDLAAISYAGALDVGVSEEELDNLLGLYDRDNREESMAAIGERLEEVYGEMQEPGAGGGPIIRYDIDEWDDAFESLELLDYAIPDLFFPS